MTVWHWVRHAPTHEKSFVGWRDVPADLSDAAAIARLRDFLPRQAILVSSDLLRATATADVVQRDSHQRLPHQPDLREMDFGAWDGLRFDAVAARDPDLSRAYWDAPGDVQAPGGESWNMAATRVAAVVARINVDHPDRDIIAVAHFGVILTQIQRALGISPRDALAHRIDNLSVTRILWRDGRGSAPLINHLP